MGSNSLIVLCTFNVQTKLFGAEVCMKYMKTVWKRALNSSAYLLEKADNSRFYEMWKCNTKQNTSVNLFLLHSETQKSCTRRAMNMIVILAMTCLKRP